MPEPVVHFEIIGTDPAKLRGYYGELFGWTFDTSSRVADAVSEPANYGFVDRITTSDGTGIPGGVGGGAGYEAHVIFYVGVPSVEAALQRAERLGGQRRLGPVRATASLRVQVDSVPGHLGLGHRQEGNGRAYAIGILDVGSVVPLLWRHADGANHSGQLAKPVGGEPSAYPSARRQEAASAAG